MKLFYRSLLILFLFNTSPGFSETPSQSSPTHGIANFGDLKYPSTFTHYDYVNPDAPKGGEVTLATSGSFDNFNPFIIKGNAAAGAGLLHCTLLSLSEDELMSMYGYLAEKVELAPDRTHVTFTLNNRAKFSDGTPVTADDVVFSFKTLMTKGIPHFRQYYHDVVKVEKLSPNQIRFTFRDGNNRELPVILGQLPVFSKAYYTKHEFESGGLVPPLGCGPYTVDRFEAGKYINYKRVPHWWAVSLPSQKGQNNYDIRYIYYRDQNVLFEGFKAGSQDFRNENISKNWAQGYDIPAVKEGKLIKKAVPNSIPQGVQLSLFNLRKPLFKDRKVREALTKAFDFEWINKNLFFNSYKRSSSYFNNSDLASSDLPEGKELKILDPLRNALPPEVFTQVFKLPVTNGSGFNRKEIEDADRLLKEAGWIIKNGKRVNKNTGQPFVFEYLLNDPTYERVALAFQRNFKALGIGMTIRVVTPSEYIERLGNFDFDMIGMVYPGTETPGNELESFFSSKSADARDGFNFAGIKNPVVDALIQLVIDSPTREDLKVRVHALDRVLLWGYYGVLQWYSPESRIAYWNKFGQPTKKPKDGIGFGTWWVDPSLEKKL